MCVHNSLPQSMAKELQIKKSIICVRSFTVLRVNRLIIVQTFVGAWSTRHANRTINFDYTKSLVVDLIEFDFVIGSHNEVGDVFLARLSLVEMIWNWADALLLQVLMVPEILLLMVWIVKKFWWLPLIVSSVVWQMSVDLIFIKLIWWRNRWRRCDSLIIYIFPNYIKRLHFACKLICSGAVDLISSIFITVIITWFWWIGEFAVCYLWVLLDFFLVHDEI